MHCAHARHASLVVLICIGAMAGHVRDGHARDRDRDRDSDEPKHAISMNRPWAVQFQVNKDADDILVPYESAIISLKHHSTRRSAWRVGLQLSGSMHDSEKVDEYLPDTLGYVTQWNVSRDHFFVGVSLLKLWYCGSKGAVLAYGGVGPSVGFGRARSEDVGVRVGPGFGDQMSRESEMTGWSAGARAAFGAEWFVRRSVSVMAEYGAVAEYVTTENESIMREQRTAPISIRRRNSAHEYRVGSTGVILGISAYF